MSADGAIGAAMDAYMLQQVVGAPGAGKTGVGRGGCAEGRGYMLKQYRMHARPQYDC